MLRAAVLFCLCSAALGGPLDRAGNSGGRIVGGSSTDITKYPYQVSVRLLGGHWCGGSIISEDFILTAAHCFNYLPLKYDVREGSSHSASGGVLHEIAQFVLHPLYGSSGHDYDIALLRLATPITFSATARPVTLAAAGAGAAAGTPSVTTGWGDLREGGPSASVLQEVEVPIVSDEECRRAYPGSITERMICAGFQEGGRDACQGDSGGPLVAGGRQVGVVSFGLGCARRGFPGVYARVAALRDWVSQSAGV